MDFEKPKRRYLRFSIAFVAVIFLVVGGIVAFGAYRKAQREKNIERIAEGLKQEEEKLYQEQLADTYGGTTPQETLRLFIAAAEKGDYDLASKYFVIERQDEELKSFTTSKKENTENILRLLKISLNSSGSFSTKRDQFVIDKPLLVDFFKYPSGVWKINEI